MNTQEPTIKDQAAALHDNAEGQDAAHDATHTLAGATVERVYYAVRDSTYTIGTCFSSQAAAVTYAKLHSARAAAGEFGEFAPKAVNVDVRAFYKLAHGGSLDTKIETFTITA